MTDFSSSGYNITFYHGFDVVIRWNENAENEKLV